MRGGFRQFVFQKSVFLKHPSVHLVHNLMARCVAWNPKEMMRQVAVAKELDSAKVGEVFKPESPLISSCRRELSCLLAGRSGTQRCRPALRRGKLSLASTTYWWTRRVATTWASPRLNKTKSFNLPFVCWSTTIWPTQVLDTISLFNHVLRDFGGPRDLSYSEHIAGYSVPNQLKTPTRESRNVTFVTNVNQCMFLFCPVLCIGWLFK